MSKKTPSVHDAAQTLLSACDSLIALSDTAAACNDFVEAVDGLRSALLRRDFQKVVRQHANASRCASVADGWRCSQPRGHVSDHVSEDHPMHPSWTNTERA